MPGIEHEAATFLVMFARVGAVLMLLPVFSEEAVPGQIRLLMALGMSAGLWGVISPSIPDAAIAQHALAASALSETLVGLSIGMIIRIMFHAAAMAGSIVSLQIGLSSALVADPSQGGHTTLLSKFAAVAAAVVCMAFDVHHLWIASIVESYGVLPVGGLPPAADFAELAIVAVGRAMALALSLAAPLIVYGILFNVALGLASRLAPAIQLFFILQPLNLILGLALFGTVIGLMLATFAQEMAEWIQIAWK